MTSSFKHIVNPDKRVFSLLVIAALVVILYASTLGHGFVWDDQIVITNNSSTIKGLSGLSEIWTSYSYLEGRDIYRPIPQSLHAIIWEFFPDQPAAFHLFSILCYLFVGWSVWLLYRTWFSSIPPWLVLIATVFFILSPVHVEVVANSKSIDEMLVAGFAALSLVFVQKRTAKNYFISLLFFGLALLSKISAITLIPIWIVLAFPQFFHSIVEKLSWNKIAPFIAGGLIGVGLLLNFLNYPKPFGIILACAAIPIFFTISNRHIRFILLLALTVLLAQNDRWEFAILVFMPLFYLELKASPPIGELVLKYILFSAVTIIFDYNSIFESVYFAIPFVFYYFFEKKNEKVVRYHKIILFAIMLIAMIRSFSDGIAIFNPLLFSIGLMSFLVLIKNKVQRLFILLIIFGSFVSTEYIYHHRDYAFSQSVLITPATSDPSEEDETEDIKKLNPYHNVLVESQNKLQKFATISRIQLVYLQKMVFPTTLIHQNGTRQIELANLDDWDVYLSIIIHLLLLLVAVYFYKQNFTVVTWGIVWYFLSMSIYTNIVRLMPDTLAERFLFMPSIGFSIAFVCAIYFLVKKWQSNEKKSIITMSILLSPLFGYYIFKTVDRTKDWKSNYTLAANTLPSAQNNAAINAQYALELNNLIKTGTINNTDSAYNLIVKHYKKAIEIYPDFYGPNADLANYYIFNAQPDSAFPYLLESYRIRPDQWLHHYYLALIYFERNNYEESFLFFKKLIENEKLQEDKNDYPELLEAYEFAGRCLHNMGRDNEAYIYLQNGIDTYHEKSTYVLLANLYRVTGKTNLAIQTFEDLLVLHPGDQEIINTIDYLKQGLIY